MYHRLFYRIQGYHPMYHNMWSHHLNPYHYNWNPHHWNNNWHHNNWWNNMWNPNKGMLKLKDYGPKPFVINIEQATLQNKTFRTALWTGKYLQLTVMSLNVGEDIGLEVHPDGDQFIRIESGQGIVQMGDSKDNLDFERRVFDDDVILIPAGKWHNLTNTGHRPMKLYVIYAPPEHPFGTVHETKADAMAAEAEHHDNGRGIEKEIYS
ncbi:MAG: cupin domain-containing protein [Bacillaceae bacterium]|nr:cupin domain-containing protein [Bacillaceae bacterium]